MKIKSRTEDKELAGFVVDMGDGRTAYLTVRKGSHPLRVHSGSASGPAVVTQADQVAAVDEAGHWLLDLVRKGGVKIGDSVR